MIRAIQFEGEAFPFSFGIGLGLAEDRMSLAVIAHTSRPVDVGSAVSLFLLTQHAPVGRGIFCNEVLQHLLTPGGSEVFLETPDEIGSGDPDVDFSVRVVADAVDGPRHARHDSIYAVRSQV